MSYYLRVKSKVFGPFDEPQLLEMKSKGKITGSTEVSKDKHNWQEAESLRFLFGPAAASQPSANTWQPLADEPVDWFYSMNGTEGYGPVTATAIEQMLQSGQLSGNSYVWKQGENARFIKSELQFSGSGGTSRSSRMEEQLESGTKRGNEIASIADKMFHHVTDTLDAKTALTQPLSRFSFIFLAVSVGTFGVHDFYVKRNIQGAIHIACLAPWIFLLLFVAISLLLESVGVHVEVDWFDSFTPSMSSINRTGAFAGFCLFILPLVSYVMAMIEIIYVTKDGTGNELERF